MISKSNINKKEYIYSSEKRKNNRVRYNLKIHYPRINDKSIFKMYSKDKPLLEAVNISDTGICFKCRAVVQKGDFVSFLIKIEDYPSFWCTSQVKWCAFNDDGHFIGCKFYSLNMEQIKIIKEYLKKNQ